MAAAKVGGIAFNSAYPVDFLADNIAIALNVIRASYAAGVKKLLFLGSSCIYPKLAPQPMSEEALLTGPLEPTNEWYAVAKIAGIKLVNAYRRQYGADFISLMPTNLYGPGDNYHVEYSHVPAALIRRSHEAKLAGTPTMTDMGHGASAAGVSAVDDFADACIFVMKHYSGDGFECRHRARHNNCRLCGAGSRCRRLSRAVLIRYLAPGRYAAEASRRLQADPAWLAGQDAAAEGIAAAYADFLACGRRM